MGYLSLLLAACLRGDGQLQEGATQSRSGGFIEHERRELHGAEPLGGRTAQPVPIPVTSWLWASMANVFEVWVFKWINVTGVSAGSLWSSSQHDPFYFSRGNS